MRRLVVIFAAVVVFLAISFALARWLTTENAERDRVVDLLDAQSRGDADAMIAQIEGCARRPACVAGVREDAARLSGPGRVEIVAYDSSTSYALGAAAGPTRVVWKTASRLTTVQCVAIRRTGSVLAGRSVTVTGLSAPIPRTAACR